MDRDDKKKLFTVLGVCGALIGLSVVFGGDIEIGGGKNSPEVAVRKEINAKGKEVVVHKVDKATLTSLLSEFEKDSINRLRGIGLLETNIQEVYDATLVKFNELKERNKSMGTEYYVNTKQWMFHENTLDMRPILKTEGIKDYSSIMNGTEVAKVSPAQLKLFEGTNYYEFFSQYSKSNGVGPYEELVKLSLGNESANQNMGSYDKLYGSIVMSKYYTYGEMLIIKEIGNEYGIEVFPTLTYEEIKEKYDEAKKEKDEYYNNYLELKYDFREYVNNYMNDYLDKYQDILDIYGDMNDLFTGVKSDEELATIVEEYKKSEIYKDNRKDLINKYGSQGEYKKTMSLKALPYTTVYAYENKEEMKLADEFKKLVVGMPDIDIQLVRDYLEQPKYINRCEEMLKKTLEEQNNRIENFKSYLIENDIEHEFTFLAKRLVYERVPYGTRVQGKEDTVTSGGKVDDSGTQEEGEVKDGNIVDTESADNGEAVGSEDTGNTGSLDKTSDNNEKAN